jgi:hypothetical protein
MGTDDQGLGVIIADDANTFVAMQFGKIRFKFGSEIIIFNVMDRPRKIFGVLYRQTPAFGPEMGMIVGSIK